MALIPSDLFLPINPRGPFFSDSFFDDAHREFENAVRKAFDDFWRPQSLWKSDFDCYRNLRRLGLREDHQSFVAGDEGGDKKIVVDVAGFPKESLSIKCSEGKLTVEGSVETKDANSSSRRAINRQFLLPELANPSAVLSSLSDDGVLTIRIPKLESQSSKEHVIPIEAQKSTQLKISNEQVKAPPTENTDKRIIPMEVVSPGSSSHYLPIVKRGDFFCDPFFQETHDMFQSAIKDVMDRWGFRKDLHSIATNRRLLREHSVSESSRALTHTEDEKSHKIVLDVTGFNEGDLKVKTIGDDQIVVEGNVEKKEEGFASKKSFCRTFCFPGLNPNEVKTTMSSDGVLTINAPKKIVI